MKGFPSLIPAVLAVLWPLAAVCAQEAASEAFQSEEGGFRVARPAADWRFRPAGGGGALVRLFVEPPGTNNTVQLRVDVHAGGAAASAEEERAATGTALAAQPDYQDLEEIQRNIGGQDALGLRLRFLHDGAEYRAHLFFLRAGGLRYLIEFHAPLGDYHLHEPQFAAILDGFAFTAPAGATADLLELRSLAERCGSELPWAADWPQAAARARAEQKLALLVVQSYPGFEIGDQAGVGPFMDPDVIALVQARYVPLRYSPDMDAPLREPETYGMSATTFGQALILARPDGAVVAQSYFLDSRAVYEFLREARPRHRQQAPARDGLEAARALLRSGEIEQAAPWIEAALAAAPDSVAARRCEADLLRLQGDCDAALAELERARAAAQAGELAELDEDRAILLARLGRYGEALAALGPEDAAAPSPRALYWRGALLMNLDQFEAGEAWWRRLIQLHPDERWAWKAAGDMTGLPHGQRRGPALRWPAAETRAALRQPPRQPWPPRRAGQALEDAAAWLLRSQRPDGSWLSPSEIMTPSGEIDVFSATITAIAGRAVLRLSKTPEARAAAERALAHLLAAWRRIEQDENALPAVFMDYTPWLHAYLLLFLADCLDAQCGAAAAVRAVMSDNVARLAAKQRESGGWSYYLSHTVAGSAAPGGESISFVTAAVTAGLLRAEQAGAPVPASTRDRALDCLESMRTASDTFGYFLHPGAESSSVADSRPGAAGRGPACALALYLGGREMLGDLDRRIELFVEHGQELGREQGKVLMHAGAHGQGSHYLMFDYANAAAAAAALPTGQRGRHRDAILELILAARNADGSFTDNPLLGRDYATAMAVQALLDLGAAGK